VLTSAAGFVGTFTVKMAGGNGGTGRNNASGTGGGGGGSGGDTTSGGNGGAGGAAGGTAGAAGTTNGGIGGVGAGIGAGNGLAPVSGNGGGGSGSAAGTSLKGGDGTVGKIILNYTAVAASVQLNVMRFLPEGPPRMPQTNAIQPPQAAGIPNISMPPMEPP
jgi:hypothetical protein